jgi:hypothetical protein
VQRTPSTCVGIVATYLSAALACGKVATVAPGVDGGADRTSGSVDAHPREAAADGHIDSRGVDGNDVVTIEATAPDARPGCVIDGVAYAMGQLEPSNPCQSCQPTLEP